MLQRGDRNKFLKNVILACGGPLGLKMLYFSPKSSMGVVLVHQNYKFSTLVCMHFQEKWPIYYVKQRFPDSNFGPMPPYAMGPIALGKPIFMYIFRFHCDMVQENLGTPPFFEFLKTDFRLNYLCKSLLDLLCKMEISRLKFWAYAAICHGSHSIGEVTFYIYFQISL